MMSRLGVWFMGVLARVPLPVLRAIGAALGRVLFVLVVPRRKIALRNLELCFPQASVEQRTQWARESFIVFCQTWHAGFDHVGVIGFGNVRGRIISGCSLAHAKAEEPVEFILDFGEVSPNVMCFY